MAKIEILLPTGKTPFRPAGNRLRAPNLLSRTRTQALRNSLVQNASNNDAFFADSEYPDKCQGRLLFGRKVAIGIALFAGEVDGVGDFIILPYSKPPNMLTRRRFLKNTAVWSSWSFAGFPVLLKNADRKVKGIQIGACDWSLGKGSDPAAFEIARQIGLKGLMVNMGDTGNNLHLREPAIQQQYLRESKRTGVAITSIALAELNQVPYKSDARTEQWVWDSVTVARALSVKVVLLAFFSANDLRSDKAGQQEVIRRLKKVMPHAEKNGIILGIESYLNADEQLAIIREVGSPNLKVYYDFRNTADAGYDTVEEFKKLGKDRVCELHIKENGHLLGEGTLDWKAIFQAIRDSGYTGDGWMQIEGAMPDKAELVDSYKHNLHYLQSI